MHGGSRRRRFARAWIALGLFAALLTFVAPTADATTIQPFASRFTANDNGAIALFGNNLLTCSTPAPACVNARNRIGSQLNNNGYFMVNVDADGAAFPTYNSSSSEVALPAGGTVLWAGLYWGARLGKGAGTGAADAPAAGRNQMQLRAPGDASYRTITSADTFGPSSTTDRAYQQFANVTTVVQGAGAGTYWGANVAAATGEDRYGGWSLVVVYRDPSLPLRNLTVFDGFSDVGQGDPETVNISGFLAPLAGAVDTQLGTVTWEGDASSSGDRVRLGTTTLATTLSQGTNFFNSTVDRNGVAVTARTPSDGNLFGVDIKDFGAPGIIPNGATSATVALESTAERYFIGVVTTAINLFSPDFTTSTKAVVNQNGHDPSAPGDTLAYTINVNNTGQDPGDTVVLTDVIPPGTLYVPGSLEIVSGPNAGPKTDAAGDDQAELLTGPNRVRFRLGTGASTTAGGRVDVPGAALPSTTTVRFEVQDDPNVIDASHSNRATINYVAATIGQPFTYVTNETVTAIVASADLRLTKTSTPDPLLPGQNLTSALVVTNTGPNSALGVTLTDTLPEGTTFVSATGGPGACTEAAGVVTCELGNLASGASVTVTVVVATSPSSTATTITNIASVQSSSTPDPDLSDNTAGSTVGVLPAADLSVTKTAPPGPFPPGSLVPFTIIATNAGPSDAPVLLDDQPAPGLVIESVSGACAELGCDLGTLAAGQSVQVVASARIAPDFTGTSIANTAFVSSPVFDPNPAARVATVTVPVGAPQADLAVTKAVSAPSVVAGDQVSYTVTVTNNGPSNATSVALTDPLPAGLTATNASSNRGTCVTDATVTCAVGDLPVGGSATVTIDAAVSADAPPSALPNTATVAAASTDPNPADNSATASTDVTDQSDISVVKRATGTPVAGAAITYELTVSNAGPSRARDVALTDALPAQLDGATATVTGPGCTLAAGTVTCAIGEIAVGDSVVVSITATVLTTGDIVNTAGVTTTATDPSTANNEATFTSTASANADVAITKAGPDSAVAGGTIVYTLTVGNAGPSPAANVTVSDPLPQGVTVVSVTPTPASAAGATVTCTFASLAAGATQTVTITASVAADLDAGARLDNAASVDSDTLDPTASNNSSGTSTTVQTQADIIVTKQLLTPATPPLAPGQELEFEITVTNAGPSVARAVQTLGRTNVAVELIDITGDITPTDCAVASGQRECSVGDLAPGETKTYRLHVRVDPAAALGDYANTVFGSTTTPESDLTNNAAAAPFTLAEQRADLTVAKRGLGPFQAGGAFQYVIDFANLGPSNATNVVVSDTLPPDLVPTSATPSSGSCTISGQTITCTTTTLNAPDGNGSVFVSGTVATTAAAGTVTNTATIASDTDDPDPATNSSSDTTTIVREADLTVSKSPATDPLVAGAPAAYTIVVTNAGPGAADAVSVRDLLPPSIVFDPTQSDAACAVTAAGVDCDLGTLAPGETRTLQVVGALDRAATDASVENTVTVTSTTDDPDPTGNTATVTTAVTQEADLSIVKLADASTPAAGNDLTYTITVTNNGPSNATNATFSDDLPLPPTAFALPEQGDVACTLTGLHLSCVAPSLAAGESRTGQITVRLPTSQPPGSFANAANVTGATVDPVASNNTSTATVQVAVQADLEVTKTLVTDPIVPGRPVVYALQIVNHGPSDAPDLLISDALSDGTSFDIGGSDVGCAASQAEDAVVVGCAIGDLGVGSTVRALLAVIPDPGFTGPLSNTTFIGSSAFDPVTDNNESTVVGEAAATADVTLTKTGPPTVAPGATATYDLAVTNNGPSTATDVTIVDDLPAGLTPGALPEGCTATGTTVSCAVGTLLNGETRTIAVPLGVDTTVTDASTLTNTASVTAAEADPDPQNGVASASAVVSATPVTPDDSGGQVSDASDENGGSLPFTGSDAVRLVLVAVGLIAVGYGGLRITRSWRAARPR